MMQDRNAAKRDSPAQKRDRERLLTRQRILKAAFDVFEDWGFTAATTHKIATQAGVATGTFYQHFRSKNDLLSELYGRDDEFAEEGRSLGVYFDTDSVSPADAADFIRVMSRQFGGELKIVPTASHSTEDKVRKRGLARARSE